jgi:hypothetical protein
MKPMGVKLQENVDNATLFLFKGSGTLGLRCGTSRVDAKSSWSKKSNVFP